MELHVGAATAADAQTAARDAVKQALEGVTDTAFALVVCTSQYELDELAAAITRELGTIPWAGCCTAGVFAGTEMLRQGVVVGALSADDAVFSVGVGGPVSTDPRGAARRAVADAIGPLPPLRPDRRRTFIVLPDTVAGNAAEVVRGCVHEAGAGAVWVGGGAGDNLGQIRTGQFGLGRAWHDRVVVVGIDAPEPLSAGIRHGWEPYGPPTMVTRAHDAVAVELEYEPAFDVYRQTAEIRGDDVDEGRFAVFAMTHPLGIPQADGEYVIRDPLAVEPDGSVRCVGEIPVHALVRVMHGERDDLLEAARSAATAAREGVEGRPGGAIVFDCVSRYAILGEGVRDELCAIRAGLGNGVPMMGCLTFGEIGGVGHAAPQFHNKTAVVLALPRSRRENPP